VALHLVEGLGRPGGEHPPPRPGRHPMAPSSRG
jgi:hypothetical protein